MKKFIAVILTSIALIQGIFAQTEKQQISEIDKIALDIKNNLNNYRKIIGEADSIMNATNTKHNFFETAFKKGKELVLVQYVDLYGHMKSADYYFNNGQLIFIEINNRDNSYEKFYYSENILIAWYRNEKEVDKTSEDFKRVGNNALTILAKLTKLYENR